MDGHTDQESPEVTQSAPQLCYVTQIISNSKNAT